MSALEPVHSNRKHGVELVDLDALRAEDAELQAEARADAEILAIAMEQDGKLTDAQRGHADLIAAAHYATLAAAALERAVRAYSADGTTDTALTRVRTRAALAKIEAALPFIDSEQ
jgi:hypothetical protein